MILSIKKIIIGLFAALLFLVPIVLWPFTSEVFEFNKIVLVYIFTTLIVSVWLTRSVLVRKIFFRRTILDIPLLVFLGSQIISTLLSIDPITSWLGYYSRFNGGFVSSLCYTLLYWAFVSNLEKKDALKLINNAFLPSAALVAAYGVAEHFGIDKDIWVQTVQFRVFSTLGQPNWLAAWLVAILPITWMFAISNEFKKSKYYIYISLTILFFWTLLFTKSRSGLLGFVVAFIIFWGLYFWNNRKEYKKKLSPFLIISASIIIVSLISGTEYSPSINQIVSGNTKITLGGVATGTTSTGDTALETGGTESGSIRKIVWKGAVDIWLHYPIFGTGVETFAFSYYKFRPVEHNLTSEWDFIYNKAHNEFLNIAANSGAVGLLAYFFLLGSSLIIFLKELNFPLKNTGGWKLDTGNLSLALLVGYISLLITNFFGFSVVPTQLELFLFPAFAIALANSQPPTDSIQHNKISGGQKLLLIFVGGCVLFVEFAIGKYWLADTYYNKGKAYNGAGKPDVGATYLVKAINLEPGQPIYYGELASSYTSIAIYYNQQKDVSNTKEFTNLAIAQSDKAISLSPANINLKRSRFGMFIMLSGIDPNYLLNAEVTLIDTISSAPTDPKLYYNLGLIYARISQPDKAIETFQKTIQLKSNYAEPRLALSYLLIDKKDYKNARNQLEYILNNIDPSNSLAKQALESLK